MQAELSFPSDSPINTPRLGGQNLRLYNYLKEGNTIHVFSQAKKDLRIGFLNSRCADLIHKHKITVYSRFITVKDIDGNEVTVKEYSLNPL